MISKSGKITISIMGSCVTRDIFCFPGMDIDDRFEIGFYCARSSIISYMSKPLPQLPFEWETSGGFEAKCARHDVFKTHWDHLERSKPDIIIFDLIDERIGLIQIENYIISASGPVLENLDREKYKYEILRPWNEKMLSLRKRTILDFILKLQSISSNVVFHKAKWAESYTDTFKNIKSFSETKFSTLVKLNNALLEEIFSIVDEHNGISIENIECKNPLAGGNHKWAFSPYHFDASYYREIIRKIDQITR